MLRFAAPLLLLLAMSANAAVKIEKASYKGWPNCYRISNGEVELIVTGDIGPRIMRYAFLGGQNFFKEFTGDLGKSGEAAWVARGGHRIWAATFCIKAWTAPPECCEWPVARRRSTYLSNRVR